jgi:hypothetical protein
MVIRASGGIYYDNDMRHNSEFIGNPPFFQRNQYAAQLIPALSLDDPFPVNPVSPTLSPITTDRHYRDAYAEVWTFGIQDRIGRNILVDATYLGNHMIKMRRLRNVNQPINGIFPHDGFAQIFSFEEAGSSNFNALMTRVEKRFGPGLSFISSYTWSHAIDDRPGQGGGLPQDGYNLRSERANADYDIRHRWVVSSVWEIPVGPGRRWGSHWTGVGRAIISGWGISAIHVLQSGKPFTVTLGMENSNSFNGADRPNAVEGVDWKPADQRPDRWIEPTAFVTPSTGSFGAVGRNTLRGPGIYNIDLALEKTHAISDNSRLEVRVEFFNLLNHPNFNPPAAALSSTTTTFGLISSTSMPERQIQFGVRLEH